MLPIHDELLMTSYGNEVMLNFVMYFCRLCILDNKNVFVFLFLFFFFLRYHTTENNALYNMRINLVNIAPRWDRKLAFFHIQIRDNTH